ncbi:DNA-3-methyladenine glycosylase [Tabrizicola piscis]|uniref:Putative 3-methyladenine DNA glycosylase n=1 Tax=Tabrizicola piscis TaxID=2494374 RepID=A0A3S8U3D3_9RHOB|nr:DNA-3-methyladenine glycosylase [Tabrizicola piscis]AZL58111.1 DNA-3-methyladenine glycosylase [Tabrizicola piscis]
MLIYDQDIPNLARALIGARLLVRGVGGTVIETEAYGRDDPASHSFAGKTARNAAMFGPPGSVYVYLSYGCHLCLNVVGRAGEAVLIRAIRPEIGVPLMQQRRGREDALATGPGRLGQALGIRLSDNGKPFGGKQFGDKKFGGDEFLLDPGEANAPLLVGPRIGITRAADRPWRFGLGGAGGFSRPFPVVPGP